MYYVNHEQIGERLNMIPVLSEAAERLAAEWEGDRPDLIRMLAQERVLHLSVELVTDVGSLLIDGFLMRDASSYEDIVDIVYGEGVFAKELYEPLQQLVRLRKPLVQEYARAERDKLHPLTARLPELLTEFGESVRRFIEKELA
ncbi:DUF86 domain-containing protein [Paenibacillus sp. GYB003]|uniref:DUF86 domain-containing protein n=1 Tax=Paenibacillus sp. GYB003 TaxID=2994392 RepID=UPI002F96D9B3